MTDVRWPAKAVDPAKDDLAGPITQLLKAIRDLDTDDRKTPPDAAAAARDPLMVIKSEATSLTKWCAGLIAGAGGISAVALALFGFIDKLGGTATSPNDRATVILAGGLVAVAVVISVAVIVWADLTARAHATAARLQARATIATAFLDNFKHGNANLTSPPTKIEATYAVQRNDGSWSLIEEFKWINDDLTVTVGGNDIKKDDIKGILQVNQVVAEAKD